MKSSCIAWRAAAALVLLSVSTARADNAPGQAPPVEPGETAIVVPPLLPVGFLVAWRPMILNVRTSSGQKPELSSDKLQPLRAMGRYTFLFDESLPFVGRLELEGGQFQTDASGKYPGSNGFDLAGRALVGAATRVSPGFNIVASAGLITRFQKGDAAGGAPRVGIFGAASNMELEFRIAPALTLSLFAEAGLLPLPYAAESNLGVLQDASELKGRIQLSLDLNPHTAIDLGYDFTRWHASFTQSTFVQSAPADQALLVEAREHALTLGIRWKPSDSRH